MSTAEPTQAGGLTTDEISERIFEACLGAFDVFAIYLGDRLGYYRALAAGEAMTSSALAAETGTAERYAREWLEQQAVTGLLIAEDPTAAAERRLYRLPSAHAEVLTDQDSLAFLAPAAVQTAAAGMQLRAVADAFRSGGGVPWEAYGYDMRKAQGDINRALFLHVLGPDWLPQIPDVHDRLSADGARVADIGCGLGWSTIWIARAYPNVEVDGYDVDEPSIVEARRNAAELDVAERVRFQAADASTVGASGYDLVIGFCQISDNDPQSDAIGGRETAVAESDGGPRDD
jgi:hypothetical protein